MDADEFNEYLEKLLKLLDSEKKIAYLMGDFNMNLLQTESHEKIGDFYNIWTSHLFVPHITLPTRITSKSKTLIDNIFSNDPDFANGVSGNFTISISLSSYSCLMGSNILQKNTIYIDAQRIITKKN